jgi:hypothetical protein
MKPAATIAAFKCQREVGGSTEELEESAHPAILEGCAAVNRPNGDAVGRHRMQSPQAPFRMTDPAAGRPEKPLHPRS